MLVGSLVVDLRCVGTRSLKEKRAVIVPILEGCRRRFGVAASEVDHQDLWQRATIAVAAVSGSPLKVAQVLDAVERYVWSFPDVEVGLVRRCWLNPDDE